ncbi:endonuclease/exonuclease/phosphatase family protein [Embleya sp. NBC_00896]|uniref:endonuclease/exonuclease/phosphatase family protein n=1 Tax=Embleya sp. NBC_00896 TaxID=2975961 RepID=UPI003868CEA4|nr:endonuclease/exonuclease/phosphatase family protein [Embleya sp. NBC_00896]
MTAAAEADQAVEPSSPPRLWRLRRRARTVGRSVVGLVFAGAVVVTGARLLVFDAMWPVAIVTVFAPYAAAASVLVLLGAALLRMRITLLVALGLVVVHTLWMLPRLTADGGPAAGGVRLRVMTSNAYFGTAPAERITELALGERVDVLVVEELTPELAADLERTGLTRELPYVAGHGEPGAAGLAIYSRRPLTDDRLLPERTTMPMPGATVEVEGRRIRIQGVHTIPPTRGQAGRWAHDMDALRREAERRTTPAIFLGDFNATLDNASFRSLTGVGLRDAHEDRGRGLARTWPMAYFHGLPPLFGIDHVLVTDGIDVVSISEHHLPRTDHATVIANLSIR